MLLVAEEDHAMLQPDGAELRNHREWREIPVLVVTAMELSEEDRRRLNGEVERVIRKSGQPRDELLGELGVALAACVERHATTSGKQAVT